MRLETATEKDLEELAFLRALLWPEEIDADTRADARKVLLHPDMVTFLARNDEAQAIGFAQASVRRDYVNGCATQPVAFLEGIYVREEARHSGVARALVAAIENWARSKGLSELASDAFLTNSQSHRMHAALGFSETERVVYFRKSLDQ
jgi:aminoglycoside 6'-N-acetyltransferase I